MAPSGGNTGCCKAGRPTAGCAPPNVNRGNSSEQGSVNSPPLDDPPVNSPDDINPSIKLLDTRNYSNVHHLIERDHLSNNNWHEWKHLMKQYVSLPHGSTWTPPVLHELQVESRGP